MKNMDGFTRVSAAALAVIKINGKYLMCLNKRKRDRGLKEYSYFGGALLSVLKQVKIN